MNSIRKQRHWYSGTVSTTKTLFGVLSAFRRERMKGMIPFMIVLYVVAIVLYLVNLVSPLAPFVYSLF